MGNSLSYLICAILRAAHGKTVRCPLPGKYPFMQVWRPLAGRIAQKSRLLSTIKNKRPFAKSIHIQLFINRVCLFLLLITYDNLGEDTLTHVQIWGIALSPKKKRHANFSCSFQKKEAKFHMAFGG